MTGSHLPRGWSWTPLGNLLAAPLANGRSVLDAQQGFPVLRLTAIRDGWVDTRQSKMGAWSEAEAFRFLVRRDDFLIVRGNGSPKLVGRGGLVRQDASVAYPDTLIRARVDTSKCLPTYLRLVWDAPFVRHQIEGQARTTAGILKVSQPVLQGVQLPLPPLPEQAEIVDAIEEEFSRLDAASLGLRRVQGHLSQLKRAIICRAVPEEGLPGWMMSTVGANRVLKKPLRGLPG